MVVALYVAKNIPRFYNYFYTFILSKNNKLGDCDLLLTKPLRRFFCSVAKRWRTMFALEVLILLSSANLLNQKDIPEDLLFAFMRRGGGR
jgi:hypothetical protein